MLFFSLIDSSNVRPDIRNNVDPKKLTVACVCHVGDGW